MKGAVQQLQIRQLSDKIKKYQPLFDHGRPARGWVYAIRRALGMSLRQLGGRLQMTPQGVRKLETSEAHGTITIKKMEELGRALEMEFVYGFVSRHGGLEQMIEHRARQLAQEIVRRTHQTMVLEDQNISQDKLKEEVQDLTESIASELPKHLWD